MRIKLLDARKRSTGTSYSANGSLPTPTADQEMGSAIASPIRDVVPELTNPVQARQTYAKMADNDAAVDVSLRAGKTPILGATFFMEPFDEKPINADIAEFCEFNLLTGTSTPWLIVLEDVLRMYEDEFSVFEKVWENREWAPKRSGANRKTYTMLKKLAYRPASTIFKEEYDNNGGPRVLWQRAIQSDGSTKDVPLNIEDIVVFTLNRRGGTLRGKSLLRTAYKHWYHKDKYYIIDGIQKERHGIGFPVIKLPPGYSKKDKETALELVQNIRTNERAGAVLPPGWELEFARLEGQPVDIIPSIDHHNGMIMLNVMVQFLLLGLSGGGGRATSGSHQDMFNKSLRHVATLVCEYINLYVIPQLVAYNFDTDEFPRLQARNIGETKDLQQWAAAMANLAAQNLITIDLATEQWVRQVADAPFKQGGRQTPEANKGTASSDSNKGDINQKNQEAGNSGQAVDNAG